MVIKDEWDPKNVNSKHISETKKLMEGKGCIYEIKNGHPFVAFKGSYFLFAANNIHEILSKDEDDLDYN